MVLSYHQSFYSVDFYMYLVLGVPVGRLAIFFLFRHLLPVVSIACRVPSKKPNVVVNSSAQQ